MHFSSVVSDDDQIHFVCVPETDQRGLEVIAAPSKSADGLKTQQKKYSFEFDKVFDDKSTQAV